jgi:5-methylcytosine-specific restriction endonuclease McrA
MNYKDTRWIRKRQVILKRDKYLCQECKRYGKTTAAQQVHHINPADNYHELILCNDNLISLCNKCHDKMHNRTDDTLTQNGLQLVERVKDKIKIFYKNYIPPGI